MNGFLRQGDVFATPFESGCMVVSPADEFGQFIARDSDGVECGYGVAMVTEESIRRLARPMLAERGAEYDRDDWLTMPISAIREMLAERH